jgi:AmmeMemoRadiSam system protein B
MAEVREPAVAGSFYPGSALELRTAVQRYIAQAARAPLQARTAPPAAASPPKAVIAPHAGYDYSGPVAGSAFARLAALRGRVARVVLLGPAHREAFAGLAVPAVGAFATPLGLMRVEDRARAALLALPQVVASDRAHAAEHSVEVQLPFLQEALGDVAIVPLVVGDATDTEAAQALERAWGGPETCIVVSSDLSHYYSYETARRLDSATARAIEELAPEEIGEEQACGRVGVRALLLVARARGLRATTLDLRNSGDTGGPRDWVVGYGAFAFA